MKLTKSIGRQAGDLLTYILLPLGCSVLPYIWGQSLICTIAQRAWLLKARSEAAVQVAREHLAVDDEAQWKTRWRLTELFEARDLWFSMLGRSKVLTGSVRKEGMPVAMDRLVLLGMHWGPSVLALQLFRDAGLAPRFVYRKVALDILWRTPFHYLYLKLLVAYIRRICAGRDITVPGARSELIVALNEPGTPVVLLDAPITTKGHFIRGKVVGLEADFYRDGLDLLVAGQARCVLFVLGMDPGGNNVLSCKEAFQPGSAEHLLERYTEMMT
ncbi:MAG: hypothetical protein ACREO9_05415, partial [Lysobacterales bacterium]